MDMTREGSFKIKPPIFDRSKFVACATSICPGASSVKSANGIIADIPLMVEIDQANNSDNDDTYDLDEVALFTKKFNHFVKTKTSSKLATKLKECEKDKIDALHELDVLKRKNMNLESDMNSLIETNVKLSSEMNKRDEENGKLKQELLKAQARLSEIECDTDTMHNELVEIKSMNDKLCFELHASVESNKLLQEKVAKLQVELDSAKATFHKLNTGSQVLDEILSTQKVASDRSGLGSKVGGSSKSKAGDKMIFIKSKSSAPISTMENKAKMLFKENNIKYARKKPNPPKAKMQRAMVGNTTTKRGEVNGFNFKPTCHNCGVIGHIRPHCTQKTTPCFSHACRKNNVPKNAKFVPTCHFCGVKGHIRPNCFKLHGYCNASPRYHNFYKNWSKYDISGYDYGYVRIQKPKYKMIPREKIIKVMPKYEPKIIENFQKVKTKPIWVRKSDLRTCANLPSNPLDDNGSSWGVDLAF
jgi:hypothetical protein